MLAHCGEHLDWERLSQEPFSDWDEPSVDWTEQLIDRFDDRWDWQEMASNPVLP